MVIRSGIEEMGINELQALCRELMQSRGSRLMPHPLLDEVKSQLGVRSDKKLSKALGIRPPQVSRMRSRHLQVGPAVILAVHEKTGMPVARIRELLAAA